MRIKLISPRMSLRPMDSEFKRVMSPSLALLTLASLTPPEHEVVIEDENTGKLNLADHPNLVGITGNVDTSHRAYRIADQYRQKGVMVILGGIHVSANPEEALAHADAVCIGEAEEVWGAILEDAQAGRLQKLYRLTKHEGLKHCPNPRWDLIDREKYLYTNIVCSSRGCPFRCDFCYNSCAYRSLGFRNRPVEEVLDEIDVLGTRHVMFVDDNFIGNIPWTEEFLTRISSRGLIWNAAVSANIGEHPNLLDRMRASGCKSLFIGFESINQESLRGVHKMQNKILSYEKLIREIHARGIMINASLAFGFDSDGPDVFEHTLAWLVRNKVETMTAHILTPYPGTKLFEQLEREGRIVDRDWSHYNTSHVVFEPKLMTPDELYRGYLWIYREFYSFGNVIKRIPDAHEQLIPYLLFNFGYRKFGKLISRIAKLGLMHKMGALAGRLAYRLN